MSKTAVTAIRRRRISLEFWGGPNLDSGYNGDLARAFVAAVDRPEMIRGASFMRPRKTSRTWVIPAKAVSAGRRPAFCQAIDRPDTLYG